MGINTHTEIVQSLVAVTLLGGGNATSGTVNEALNHAPNLVAADGGARFALEIGHSPSAVIGDFDSIDAGSIARIDPDRLHRIPEQNSTDFEKCLANIAAPLILAVGFTGPRLDHTLAALNALTRFPDQSCILVGDTDICFLAKPEMRFDLPKGTRFSLFPMGDCRVDATGLRWPLDQLPLAPTAQISTSNEVLNEQVTLCVSEANLLVILPRGNITAAINALAEIPDIDRDHGI